MGAMGGSFYSPMVRRGAGDPPPTDLELKSR
jgi:hypothetical protein